MDSSGEFNPVQKNGNSLQIGELHYKDAAAGPSSECMRSSGSYLCNKFLTAYKSFDVYDCVLWILLPAIR